MAELPELPEKNSNGTYPTPGCSLRKTGTKVHSHRTKANVKATSLQKGQK